MNFSAAGGTGFTCMTLKMQHKRNGRIMVGLGWLSLTGKGQRML